MLKLIQPISKRYTLFLFLGICLVLLLTLLTSLYYFTPLQGISKISIGRLDTGWMYEKDGQLFPLQSLPCKLELDTHTLKITRGLSDISQNTNNILTFRTRYQSIRVWADDVLIYEAAQGKEHALSSMWHFIPLRDYAGASSIHVELIRYDSGKFWDLSTVLLDHPDVVQVHLCNNALPAILFWLLCMLFTLVLLFISIFMMAQKIPGASSMAALAAFIFLSGMWILLDSKITTLYGGNYAFTYFFSYAAFYLLMAPYLVYIQLMLDRQSRAIRYLTWIFVVNAGLCMVLHLLGIVSIKNTAFTVHILIFISLLVSIRAFWRSVVKQKEKQLFCTFCGTIFIYAAGLVSIVLYYIGKLPPTNSTTLYSWALLVLILCATVDEVFAFGRYWKQKQYLDHYRQLATQDSMTMLGNRNAYELRLQELIVTPLRELAIVLFDVDNLKSINDTYGHHVGDQAIYITAQSIQKVFEPVGSCYRIGGDEFCVILTVAADIEQLLRKYDDILELQHKKTVFTSVSYGWAEKTFDGGKASYEEIMLLQKSADINLYQKKKEKKAQKESVD